MIAPAPVSYQESQRFNRFWTYVAFGVVIFLLVRVVSSLMEGIPVTAYNWTGLCFSIALHMFLVMMRLDIVIDQEGIKYRFFPFRRYTVIPWGGIETITVRSFSALAEFGGWGMRYNFHETAYIMSGNDGIELKLKNKKRLFMLGTQRPTEARQIIHSLFFPDLNASG